MHLLGIEIKPVLAGLGIAGLAVALALQDTLSNFFSAISLNWALVTLPTFVLFGTPDPFSIPAAFFNNSEARGVCARLVFEREDLELTLGDTPGFFLERDQPAAGHDEADEMAGRPHGKLPERDSICRPLLERHGPREVEKLGGWVAKPQVRESDSHRDGAYTPRPGSESVVRPGRLDLVSMAIRPLRQISAVLTLTCGLAEPTR